MRRDFDTKGHAKKQNEMQEFSTLSTTNERCNTNSTISRALLTNCETIKKVRIVMFYLSCDRAKIYLVHNPFRFGSYPSGYGYLHESHKHATGKIIWPTPTVFSNSIKV